MGLKALGIGCMLINPMSFCKFWRRSSKEMNQSDSDFIKQTPKMIHTRSTSPSALLSSAYHPFLLWGGNVCVSSLAFILFSAGMEREVVTLNDFSMLSMIGIGNYAKVILVRRKASGRIYAMKIVKKRREEGELKGIRKTHAYIEKEILVPHAPRRPRPRTPSSSSSTPPSRGSASSIIFSSIAPGENSLGSSAG